HHMATAQRHRGVCPEHYSHLDLLLDDVEVDSRQLGHAAYQLQHVAIAEARVVGVEEIVDAGDQRVVLWRVDSPAQMAVVFIAQHVDSGVPVGSTPDVGGDVFSVGGICGLCGCYLQHVQREDLDVEAPGIRALHGV